jgi:hypothetical protein
MLVVLRLRPSSDAVYVATTAALRRMRGEMDQSQPDLSGLIRARISTSSLPDGAQIRIHASLSSGSTCGCCDHLIDAGDVQFSVQHCGPDGVRHFVAMHSTCFHAWRAVVDALEVRVISPSVTASHVLSPS